MPRQHCHNCGDGYLKARAAADGMPALFCNPCGIYLAVDKTSWPEHFWSATAQARALLKRAAAAGVAAEEPAPAPPQAKPGPKVLAKAKAPAKAPAKVRAKVKATAKAKRKAKVAPEAPQVTRAGRKCRAPPAHAHYDLTKAKPRARR